MIATSNNYVHICMCVCVCYVVYRAAAINVQSFNDIRVVPSFTNELSY